MTTVPPSPAPSANEAGLRTRLDAALEGQRLAETALAALEERYRLAALATNDAIWDWDFASNHVAWNAALEASYGHTPSEVDPTGEWWIA